MALRDFLEHEIYSSNDADNYLESPHYAERKYAMYDSYI